MFAIAQSKPCGFEKARGHAKGLTVNHCKMFGVIIDAQGLDPAENCRKGLHIRQDASGVDIELVNSSNARQYDRR